MWRQIRILLLLLILAIAAWTTFYDRWSTTDWDETLTIGVYPVADGDAATRKYLSGLDDRSVAAVENFLNEEAAEHGIGIARPVSVRLYPAVSEKPPERPKNSGKNSGVFDNMIWSLRLRMYARRAALSTGKPMPQIRIFVLYHNPEVTRQLSHSVGLQKGLVGLVHGFADPTMTQANNVVIAHEILHTLGATDKYDPQTLAPLYPMGYAEPDRQPRHPQQFAEIMAGRMTVAPGEYVMPESLEQVIVGAATALEINWSRK